MMNAPQQAPRLTIEFDAPTLDYVFNLLRTRPHGEVDGLVQDIRRQVADQQHGAALTKTEAPAGGPVGLQEGQQAQGSAALQ